MDKQKSPTWSQIKKQLANLEARELLDIISVEQGVICTNNYGDIDERFYSSLESVYADAVALLRQLGSHELIVS